MVIKNNANLPMGWRVCAEAEAEKFGGDNKFVGVMPIRNGVGLIIHEADKFRWRVAGGGSKLNETLRQTATRELKEEVGLEADGSKLIFITAYVNMNYTHTKTFYIYKLDKDDLLVVTEPTLDEDEGKGEYKLIDLGLVNKNKDCDLSVFHSLALAEISKRFKK